MQAPLLDQHPCLRKRVEARALSSSLRSLPFKNPTQPFFQGLPGSIDAVLVPTPPIQPLTAMAVNSGPYSERMNAGAPRTRFTKPLWFKPRISHPLNYPAPVWRAAQTVGLLSQTGMSERRRAR